MSRKHYLTMWLFFPQLLLAGVLLYGVWNSVWQSFGYMPAVHLTTLTTQYYQAVFCDPKFLAGLGFTLKISFWSATLAVGLGLVICYLLLHKVAHPERLLRWLQIPIIIPHLIVALFILLLLTKTGLIARVMVASGLARWVPLLGGTVYSENALGIILAYLWKEVPFIIFFCYPLLKAYTTRFAPVAVTLGASRWQTFWFVTLPNCWHTIASSFCIVFAYAVGAYELPALLGPTLPDSLPELAYVAYAYPDLTHRPYAMVINVVMALLGLICVIGYLLSAQQEEVAA